MLITPYSLLHLAGFVIAGIAVGYSVVAVFAVWIGTRRVRRLSDALPAVTVLKPLCGSEPYLFKSLESFCVQDYPEFQIVFGVCDAGDPALSVVRQLQARYPDAAIDVVINERISGANPKANNLINMMPAAKNDCLVIADSDIRVAPDYLARVVAPLADSSVGIVTCLYHSRPIGGLYSRLASLFIAEWFAPSVLVAHLFRSDAFAFGATIGIRRNSLEAVGGFAAVADHLADDYMLGALTRKLGLRTVLSDVVVETLAFEPRLRDLVAHELRWLRTIRCVQPLGYNLCFVTLALPLTVALIVATGAEPLSMGLFDVALACRLLLHAAQSRRAGVALWQDLWLLPLRDLLTAYIWARALSGRTIRWRDQGYRIARNGYLHRTT